MLKKLNEDLKEFVKQTIAQRILYLKAVGAPKEIVFIGEKMLEDSAVTNAEAIEFYDWNVNGKSWVKSFEEYLENRVKEGNVESRKVLEMWKEVKKG